MQIILKLFSMRFIVKLLSGLPCFRCQYAVYHKIVIRSAMFTGARVPRHHAGDLLSAEVGPKDQPHDFLHLWWHQAMRENTGLGCS